jgi:hypothetical protein
MEAVAKMFKEEINSIKLVSNTAVLLVTSNLVSSV